MSSSFQTNARSLHSGWFHPGRNFLIGGTSHGGLLHNAPRLWSRWKSLPVWEGMYLPEPIDATLKNGCLLLRSPAHPPFPLKRNIMRRANKLLNSPVVLLPYSLRH